MNIFRKKRTPHPDAPFLFGTHQGDIFTPGAMSTALNTRVGNPIYSVRGAGNAAGSLRVLQEPQVFQSLALPSSPVQGVPVGYMTLQGLLDEEPTT